LGQLVLGQGERILLIEDWNKVREATKILLEYLNYEVVAVEGKPEALEALANDSGEFDLLFSEVILNDGNGAELVDEARQMGYDGPVLFYTGQDFSILADSNVPKNDYLIKGGNLSEVSRRVREKIEERNSEPLDSSDEVGEN
jgi:DNA-binding NtrC family response regulator